METSGRALSLDGRAFIAGARCNAASNETFPTLNPSTGKVLAEVAKCDAKDIDRAVVAAREAFESGVWSKAAPAQQKGRGPATLAQLIDEQRRRTRAARSARSRQADQRMHGTRHSRIGGVHPLACRSDGQAL